MMWYARELGLACLAEQTADTEKIAREQGWTLEQTLHQMLRAEYERRLAGRQKQRIKTAGFT